MCVLAAAHCGDVEEGERVLAPLREFGPPVVDTMRPQSYVELQQSVDKMIPPGRIAYVKSDFLGPARRPGPRGAGRAPRACDLAVLPDPAAPDGRRNRTGAGGRDRVRQPRRRVDGDRDRHLAGPHREPRATRHLGTVTLGRPCGPGRRAPTSTTWATRASSGCREAYGAAYPRLAALKEAWDPDDVFRLNQHISPKTAPLTQTGGRSPLAGLPARAANAAN